LSFSNLPQTSAAVLNKPVFTSTIAADCWPTPLGDDPQPDVELLGTYSGISSKMDTENTEDICLVYDDDTDMGDYSKPPGNKVIDTTKTEDNNTPAPKSSSAVTPKEKTPRRVEFRTISTPKSKKKLL